MREAEPVRVRGRSAVPLVQRRGRRLRGLQRNLPQRRNLLRRQVHLQEWVLGPVLSGQSKYFMIPYRYFVYSKPNNCREL